MTSEKYETKTKIHLKSSSMQWTHVWVHLALLNLHCFFVLFYRRRKRDYNANVADSKENLTDEDREYHEENGDDYTEGATSHPIS